MNAELSRIQRGLIAPKNQTNAFGKYKYRSCEDILEALKPLLNDCSVVVSDEIQMVGDRIYVKATATIFHGEKSISATGYAREPLSKKGMDDAQLTGATSSYARKYALNGLFAIDDNKDADSMDNTKIDHSHKLAEMVSVIKSAKSIADLRVCYNKANDFAKSVSMPNGEIIAAKNSRKNELEQAA